MHTHSSSDVERLSGAALPKERSTARAHRRQTIEALKARDNVTNVFHLAHVYAVIIVTVGVTVWSFGAVSDAGFSWWWNIPAAVLAIAIMGASQHQLGGAVHEACHYMLFKSKAGSEAASDWLGAFPIYTTTHAFRLHHLAHHQFVNDPARDPNFDQAKDSGHWLDFPVAHIDFLMAIARLLNPVRLAAYIMARVRYSAIGVETNPYAVSEKMGSPWIVRVTVLYVVGGPFLVLPLVVADLHAWAAALLIAGWAGAVGFFWAMPGEAYQQNKINPVISRQVTQINFVTFFLILYGALTATEYATGVPTWGYFFLLWVVPLFTTFPLFMILREWLQHGNADRGKYTNSRVFLVNPLLRYAVFPWGMDYHLPHHVFASVPHYKLRDLHDFLMEDPKYAQQCRVVEGWSQPAGHGFPTIIDVLGPNYTPHGNPVHVNDETLEHADVADKDGIAAHKQASLRDQTAR